MTDLIKIEKVTAVDVFNNDGLDPLLKQIKEEVRSFVPDLTTAGGRKAIASLAAKVAKSKTYLDSLGKDLVADQKATIKKVDAERKRMREDLDLLKVEVRKPLTDWENKEKYRVEHLNIELNLLKSMSAEVNPETFVEYTSADLAIIMKNVEAIDIGDDWDEFKSAAEQAKEQVLGSLHLSFTNRKKAEDDQAELDRLRREQKEREKREHEEAIARQAAEKAEREAAEKAEQERARVEQEQQEAQRKADQERKAAQQVLENERLAREESERKAADAIERGRVAKENAERMAAESAERERVAKESAEREAAEAEQRRLDGLKKAEEDAARREQEAIERERNRQLQEKADAESAARKREANTKHRGGINRKAMEAIVECCGLTDEQAKAVVTSIAKCAIPSVYISY
jgi:hypothetical protein